MLPILKAPKKTTLFFPGVAVVLGGGGGAPGLLWLHKLCFWPGCVRALSLWLPSAAEESVSVDEPSPAFIGPNGTISWAAKPNYLLKREATPANHGCLTWFARDEETG